MADKKESFTVTDRRLFTPDGELRRDSVEEPIPPQPVRTPEAKAAPAAAQPLIESPAEQAVIAPDEEQPDAPPTAAEQQAGVDAYRQSSKNLDRQVELGGHSAKDLEMTFERFMASLYMTAMLQLGLMREQNANPGVDLIGARQTI